jgi:hypothetical protein
MNISSSDGSLVKKLFWVSGVFHISNMAYLVLFVVCKFLFIWFHVCIIFLLWFMNFISVLLTTSASPLFCAQIWSTVRNFSWENRRQFWMRIDVIEVDCIIFKRKWNKSLIFLRNMAGIKAVGKYGETSQKTAKYWWDKALSGRGTLFAT